MLRSIFAVAFVLLSGLSLPRSAEAAKAYVHVQTPEGLEIAGVQVNFRSAGKTESKTTDPWGNANDFKINGGFEYTISIDAGWDLEVGNVKPSNNGKFEVVAGANPVFKAIDGGDSHVYSIKLVVTRGPLGGRVTSRGRGVKGITVRAFDRQDQPIPGAVGVSGDDGVWLIEDIRQKCVVRADNQIEVNGQKLSYQYHVTWSAEPGRRDYDFRITRAPIAGRVIDSSDKGVAGVTVRLSGGSNRAVEPVTTGDDGDFVFRDLDVTNPYTVFASRTGFHFGAPLERRIAGETDLKIQLRSGAIAIKAHHPDGDRGGLISVELHSLANDEERLVWRDNVRSDTEFVFPQKLAPGRYLLKPKTRDAELGQELTYDPVQVSVGDPLVELFPPVFIRGTVGSNGSPLSGVTVSARDSSAPESDPPLEFVTNREGKYILTGVKPSTRYTLSAELGEKTTGVRLTPRFPPGFATHVEIKSTPLDGMNFAATRVISGRITAVGEADTGVPGIVVQAGDESATTDEEGHFEIDGYGIQDQRLIRIEPSMSGMRFEPGYAEVRPGAGNVQFAAEGGASGRIVYKDGSPASGVSVEVTSREDIQFSAPRTATTDVDGRFFVPGTQDRFRYTVKPSGASYQFSPKTMLVRGQSASEFRVTRSPPEISTVAGQFVSLNSKSGNLAVSVSDRETEPARLTVFATSSDESVIPSSKIQVTGTGENRTISFETAEKPGHVTITLAVRDEDFNDVSSSFQVSVGLSPTFRIDEMIVPGNVQNPKVVDMNDQGDILAAATDENGKTIYGVLSSRAGWYGGQWVPLDPTWKPTAINNEGLIALDGGEVGANQLDAELKLVAIGPHVPGGPRLINPPYSDMRAHILGGTNPLLNERVSVKAVDLNDRGEIGISAEIQQTVYEAALKDFGPRGKAAFVTQEVAKLLNNSIDLVPIWLDAKPHPRLGMRSKDVVDKFKEIADKLGGTVEITAQKQVVRTLLLAVRPSAESPAVPQRQQLLDYEYRKLGFPMTVRTVKPDGSVEYPGWPAHELKGINQAGDAIISYQGSMNLYAREAGELKFLAFSENDMVTAIAPNNQNFAAVRTIAGGFINYGGQVVQSPRIVPYIDNVLNRSVRTLAPLAKNHADWLGTIPLAINDQSEVAGVMVDPTSRVRPFYFRRGQNELFDLNDLVSFGTRWKLEDQDDQQGGMAKTLINNRGEIAGVGINPSGQERIFRAVPVVEAGTAVPRPAGAVPIQPDIPTNALSAFVWSFAEKTLYAVKPTETVIRWKTSTDRTDDDRIEQRVVVGWPKMPQLHVVGAPVELQPVELSDFAYTFRRIAYQPRRAAAVDLTQQSRIFNASEPGYCVLEYAETHGEQISPEEQKLFFQVVLSQPADHADFAAVARLGEEEGRRGPLPDDLTAPLTRSHKIGMAIHPPEEVAQARIWFGDNGIEFFAEEPGQRFDGRFINFMPLDGSQPAFAQGGGIGASAYWYDPPGSLNILVDTAGVSIDNVIKAANNPLTGTPPLKARRILADGPNSTVRLATGSLQIDQNRTVGLDTRALRLSGGWIGHDDYPGRTGFVLNSTTAPIDAVGEDAAYQKAGHTGTILPVNKGRVDVAWYRRNAIGVAWPDRPVRYELDWPTDAETIVIADQPRESAGLPESLYPDAHVYHQPNRDLAGFNPNEEHADVVDGKVFALRSDINALGDTSQPFVLVKYRNPVTSEWAMKPFHVIPEDDAHRFHYLARAGIEVQPPYPLNLLAPLAQETRAVYGPLWRDVKGKHYGYAAGPGGTDAVASIRYFYPLQKNFYIPREWGLKAGDNVAWLQHYSPLTDAPQGVPKRNFGRDPIDCLFSVTWPDDLPSMKLNDTLSTARDGLPSISTQQRAEVIFESMNPDGAPDRGVRRSFTSSMVRIYDPISERAVTIPKLPDYLQTTLVGSRKAFPGLPFHLQVRFLADDLDPSRPVKLIFQGKQVTKQQPGSGLLLPNIMTAAERDLLRNLDRKDGERPDPAWAEAIDRLYLLTRNPNQIRNDELSPAGGNDQVADSLLTGMGRAWIVKGENGAESISREKPANSGRTQPVVLPESFPAGNNVLTTALAPGRSALDQLTATVRTVHVSLDGTDDWIEIGPALVPAFGDFAIEFRTRLAAFGETPRVLLKTKSEAGQTLLVTADSEGTVSVNGRVTAARLQAGKWQHLSLVSADGGSRILIDGVVVDRADAPLPNPDRAESFSIGGPADESQAAWSGAISEIRIWQGSRSDEDIKRDATRQATGREPGLVGYWRCSEGIGAVSFDRTGRGQRAALKNGARFESGENVERPNGYVTLAFNNDAKLKGLPVSLEIIRIDPELAQGSLRVLPSDNVFDERLTLRHSSDYGGATADYEFEWYYHRGSDNPSRADRSLIPPRKPNDGPNPGWLAYGPTRQGANQITLGQGGESGVLVISDNRWMMRYRPRQGTPLFDYLDGRWSEWVGAPGLDPPEAQLAEGWIKRVTRALNPFDARTDDFRNSKVNTYASLLVSAGKRYEGPIAFNPDADAINSIGLIEAYETVLRRGRQLSIDAAPAVRDDSAANQALLHAASKISDLYVLLANEAFADAQDPTIGYSTSDGQVGALAPSIFAFENQLSSLLDEELCLLRGIDRSSGAPAYNRLRWNMTGGNGQLAYVNVYNIYDEDAGGKIGEEDAMLLYPQGHGDAWGHYLTAVRSFYRLLRHPNFKWEPRKEAVLLAGAPVDVDYMDERKFATAAAARARTGAEIVSLTYRQSYVSDPEQQFDGYPDSNSERAWGVGEWARRAGQGAYFDWVVGNAILPDVDPDATHEGIEKIDRTTVRELTELTTAFGAIQTVEDNANDGLNPLGLVDGAIAFDIDPNEVDRGRTQYEQIASRASAALENAVTVFDYANSMSRNLRRTQDSAAEYAANVADQETDYRNRLIEIFGYPHDGRIGPGQPYASGYNGPDLLFYNYVDPSELTGQRAPSTEQVKAFFNAASDQISNLDDVTAELSTETEPASTARLSVTMPVSDKGWPFVASGPEWGGRRAPGEVQLAISELLQAENSYRRSLQEYSNHLKNIDGAIDDLRSKYNLDAANLSVLNWKRNSTIAMNTTIGALHTTETALNRTAEVIDEVFETVEKAVPRVVGFSNDVTAPIRATIRANGIAATQSLAVGADAAEVAGFLVELGKEQLDQDAEIKIFKNDSDADLSDLAGELEQLIQQEVPLRMALYNQRDQIQQAHARYLMVLQKGLRLLEQRESFRRRTAGLVSQNRYRDMTFRVFRNSAIQKYRVQFDLAARYVYLAAKAYDYETTLLSGDRRAATQFLDDIVRQRALGEWAGGRAIGGRDGLTSSLAMLNQNFSELKGQLGLNNSDSESGVFSLRSELFRIRDDGASEVQEDVASLDDLAGGQTQATGRHGMTWRQVLENHRVDNLWDLPVFRRHCRPFAQESAGPQPGIVIPFATTIESGRNFFGWPLGGGESSFDASQFATKIRSVGVVFEGYPATLSNTPRVYLVPIGTDIMRSARGRTMEKREFRVTDQAIPVPFPISSRDVNERDWSPLLVGDGDSFADIRRFSRFRAFGMPGEYGEQLTRNHQQTSSRLIGRSVWNTRWMLIIPGESLSGNAKAGVSQFIQNVDDINLTLETYSSSGN